MGMTAVRNYSGKAVQSGTSLLNQSNGTWQATDGTVPLPSVTLPAAGTYLLTYNVRAEAKTSSGAGFIAVRLYDVTAGAPLADTNRLMWYPATSTSFSMHAAYSMIVTVTQPTTVRLEASRNDAAGWDTSQLLSDANGKTVLGYVRLT